MLCPCCITVPTVIIQLVATAFVLSYGQRSLTKNSNKWVRHIVFIITLLVSLVLVGVGLFLLVLVNNDDLRNKGFAHFCSMQNLKDSGPMDEIRCSLFKEANISGKLLEFGPGPGTNFKCFVNSTAIEDYVGVEPNKHFEENMMVEKEKRGLTFPIHFSELRGEDLTVPSESFDVAIMTHVMCSVESVETVLANAERALKSGGKIVFMEHVKAEDGTKMKLFQDVVGPIFNIIGNGCQVRDLKNIIENALGDRFDVEMMVEFEGKLQSIDIVLSVRSKLTIHSIGSSSSP